MPDVLDEGYKTTEPDANAGVCRIELATDLARVCVELPATAASVTLDIATEVFEMWKRAAEQEARLRVYIREPTRVEAGNSGFHTEGAPEDINDRLPGGDRYPTEPTPGGNAPFGFAGRT